ncbi:MAG: hypothetical protein AB4060_02450 [Crocosphaera sp.]
MILQLIGFLLWLVLGVFIFVVPVTRFCKDYRILNKQAHPENTPQENTPEENGAININFWDYLPSLRVPIIGLLILLGFPIIAKFSPFSKFLENLLVLVGAEQLVMVMLMMTLTSITIISVLKTITIFKNPSLNINDNFILGIAGLTFFLPLLNFIFLYALNSTITSYNFKIAFWGGFLLSLILLAVFISLDISLFNDDNTWLKETYTSQEIAQLQLRRLKITFVIVSVEFVIYCLAGGLNYPQIDGKNFVSPNLQAPTLLYALLIIGILTILLGGLTYYWDLYFEEVQDQNSQIETISNDQNIISQIWTVFESCMTKIFRTFGSPLILGLILFSALSYGFVLVDHYFQLEPSEIEISMYENNDTSIVTNNKFIQAIGSRLCPEEFQTDQSCHSPQSLVLVAASGGGIQASGWTAQVLEGLQKEIGEDFTKSIGLISSVSGGSVGTMFYLDKLKNGILYQSPEEENNLFNNATEDWLASVGWGLAYPDLWRISGFPFLVQWTNKYLDRGYALEKDWQQHLSGNITLDNWYQKIINGEIPIPVFNATLVENGRRFLISPLKFINGDMINYLNVVKETNEVDGNGEKIKIREARALDLKTLFNCGSPEELKQCDLNVTTAARLSASFPYVSPMPRNDIKNKFQDPETGEKLQNYHIADGGFFDNGGTFTVIEWLDYFLKLTSQGKDNNILQINKVVIVDIDAFSEAPLKQQEKGNLGFFNVALGPFNTLNGVRDATQISRNLRSLQLLEDKWINKGVKIENFSIAFPLGKLNQQGKFEKYNQPLSWRLTDKQKHNLKEAWKEDPEIQKTVTEIKTFWEEEII